MSEHSKFIKGFKKADKICIDKDEFIKEHKKLVTTLESGDKKEQKKEAKDQQQELDAETSKSSKIKKSEGSTIDFKNSKVMIDSKLQQMAEETAPPELINYIKASCQAEISKIPFSKGILTLSQKEPGLYSGFFQDREGQVIHEFENMTPEIVAKNMQLKDLYNSNPLIAAAGTPTSSEPVEMDHHEDEPEDREIARQEAVRVVSAAHDRIDMLHNRLDSMEEGKKAKYIKIKYGDFELEIKKSLHEFVGSFKKAQPLPSKSDIVKGVKAWRRNNSVKFESDLDAARHLMENWEDLSEGFFQAIYAEKQKGN